MLFPCLLKAQDIEKTLENARLNLVVGDALEAYNSLEKIALNHPENEQIQRAVLKSLSKLRKVKPLLRQWDFFKKNFPYQAFEISVLEQIAWTVLEEGSFSSSWSYQLTSLVGASWANDAKSVDFLHRGVLSSNLVVRRVAVSLLRGYRDESLIEDLKNILESTRSSEVIEESLQVIAAQNIVELLPYTQNLLEDNKISWDNKLVAAQVYVSLLQEKSHKQIIEELSQSSYPPLKVVLCRSLESLQDEKFADVLISLLEDEHYLVRLSAWRALGILRPNDFLKTLQNIPLDAQEDVAMIQSWVGVLYEIKESSNFFREKILSEGVSKRRLAASILSMSGEPGKKIMKKIFEESDDDFVKANLALGLLPLQEDREICMEFLYNFLRSQSQKLMFLPQKYFIGQTLLPSEIGYRPDIANFPQVVNQATRLQILGILSENGYHQASDAFLDYLESENWEIPLYASFLYLEEGPSEAFEILKNILVSTRDSKLKLKAALVLAFWGKDPQALTILEDSFSSVDRRQQLYLLEAMGRVASKQSLPFLVEQLKDPSKRVRLIAAASLLQCLYH